MLFKITKFIILLLIIFNIVVVESQKFRGGSGTNNGGNSGNRIKARNCPTPRLQNGHLTPMLKGRMMKFSCNKGFQRYGDQYAECSGSRWNINTFPICIKAGCLRISPEPDNGRITYLNLNASVLLLCEPNYEVIGSSHAHCNGTHWDRQIGTCRETDNTPQTFCDFESESICGWTHDTDHDTDFERHNGYNNSTMTIYTGPRADHTIGIPLVGHYMILNTNTEVSTKRARLLSPLYNFASANTICFKFYYTMHGIAVGTLRLYMKPESIDMQDILQDDFDTEKKSEYIIFEISGTQGNGWNEGIGTVKSINESFQIIIEAISGQTRISDIAIDDFSLLSDDDCITSDDESTTKKAPRVENTDDEVLSVDSCAGRCFERIDVRVSLRANHSLTCSCSTLCQRRVNCCPDFLSLCVHNVTSITTSTSAPSVVNTTISLTSTTLSTTTTSTKMMNLTTILPFINTTTILQIPETTTMRTTQKLITPKSSTTSLPQATTTLTTKTEKITQTTTSTSAKTTSSSISQTIKSTLTTLKALKSTIPPRAPTVINATTKTTTKFTPPTKTTMKVNQHGKNNTRAASDYEYEKVSGEDEHEMKNNSDEDDAASIEKSSGVAPAFHETDRITMEDSNKFHFPIKIIVITLGTVALLSLISIFIYHQYREKSNPLNYKEKSRDRDGSCKADNDFSEIRYLTSDETLDFNIMSENDF